MRRYLLAGLGLGAIVAASGAAAVTLTPIANYVGVNGSGSAATGVSALAINNNGFIAGSVSFADGSNQGFLRAPDGTYTLFSYGSEANTYGRAISSTNAVVGYATDVTGNIVTAGEEFKWTAGGGFTTLQNGGVNLHGIAQGINDSGVIVGDYFQLRALPRHGFQDYGFALSPGGFASTASSADPAFVTATRTAARGIDTAGDVVGWLNAPGGAQYGWVVPAGTSSPTLISNPAGIGTTYLEAVSNSGLASGVYTDTSGNGQAFVYNLTTHAFTDLSVPGATYVQSFGLNDLGKVVVNSDTGSFIVDLNGGAPGSAPVFMPVAGAHTPPGVSQFLIKVQPNVTYNIDPASAAGFIFTHGAGPLFASVTAPTGVAPGDQFQLWLYDSASGHWAFDTNITGGVAFSFAGGGVRGFELLGIPHSVVSNPTSFVAGVTFESAGTFNGQEIAVGVPEPATWTLMLLGVGGVGALARRRRRQALAAAI